MLSCRSVRPLLVAANESYARAWSSRLLPGQPDRHRVRVGQAVGAGQRPHVRAHPRVQPRVLAPHVPRVRGQPLPQLEPARSGERGKVLDVRPGPLRVHVVRCQRADPAPVVDAGAQQQRQLRRVGRGSAVPAARSAGRAAPGRQRASATYSISSRSSSCAHRGVGLGPEVLHDALLHVPVAARRGADRQDRLDPLGRGLADAHQDPGRERHRLPAGVLDHPQPHRRVLVGDCRGEQRPAR